MMVPTASISRIILYAGKNEIFESTLVEFGAYFEPYNWPNNYLSQTSYTFGSFEIKCFRSLAPMRSFYGCPEILDPRLARQR